MNEQRSWYQLYNPSHQTNLINLFQTAQVFLPPVGENEVFYPSNDEENAKINKCEHRDGTEETLSKETSGSGLFCTSCDTIFTNLSEQRQHFKLDWHRHNIKLKEHGQKAISEAEFMEIMDGLSSISGSEDEDSADVPSQLSRIIEKVTIGDNSETAAKNVNQNYSNSGKVGSDLSHTSKVYFGNDKNQIIAVNRVLFPSSESCEIFNLAEFLKSPPLWGVVMISGGHFAAGLFQGGKETVHKTIHRYTVRAKQGGSQSRADNKSGGSGGPKSAGASLRRYNELTLTQEIQTLLKSWEQEFGLCEWIFYRVGGSSHHILFGGKTPIFQKSNSNLRTIPFPTKRPTFSEVKRVIAQLTSVQVYHRDDFLMQYFAENRQKTKSPVKVKTVHIKLDRGRSRSPKKREEPEKPSSPDEASDSELDTEFTLDEIPTQINFRNELQEYDDSLTQEERRRKRRRKTNSRKTGKMKIELTGTVATILNEMMEKSQEQAGVEPNETALVNRLRIQFHSSTKPEDFASLASDLNQPIDADNSTILHFAVKENLLDLVWFLLEFGGDPSVKDKLGKYPYNWSSSKECRNLFRRFRGQFPEKYDYHKGQVPSGLTEELEQEMADKRKVQNKLKREKEKAKKMEKKEKADEADEEKRFLSLSDREKRALAADRRLLGQCMRNGELKPVLVRCFDCAQDITGKVPFEYNQNKFCSTKCLVTHRKKVPTPLSV